METPISTANPLTYREDTKVETELLETVLELNTPTVVDDAQSRTHSKYVKTDSQPNLERREEGLNSATLETRPASPADVKVFNESTSQQPQASFSKRKRDSATVEIITGNASASRDVTFRAPINRRRPPILSKHGPDYFPIMMASGAQRKRLPKIPREATNLLHEMKRQSYKSVLFTRFGIKFYPQMIQRLHEGGNLDVGTVEAYLQMIIHNKSHARKTVAVPTRRSDEAISLILSDELRTAELIFFPLLDPSDESWSLVVLDRRHKTLFSYGAHGKKATESRSNLIPIQNWIEQVGLDHDDWLGWSVGLAPHRHQLIHLKKNRDSGVYLLINAHHLAQSKAPRHYSANDIPYHRLRIAYELAIGALL